MKYLKKYKLFEKISVSDDDVNLIYDRFFKKDIEELQNTNKLRHGMFDKNINAGTTDLFVSDKCKEAHKINPCEIKINIAGSHYNFNKKYIAFSVSYNVINHLVNNDGDLEIAVNYLPNSQKTKFRNEFEKYRIKGMIAHEIAHWLDDTFNSSHICKYITKIGSKYKNIPYNIVNSSKIEIEGQINNIKQFRKEYIDLWDNMTFMSMIEQLPTLSNVYNMLNDIEKQKWIKDIKKRMHREGLLGKKMV